MSQDHFEPWRREGPVNDPLAERVGQRWEWLIQQSKQAVASLRQATAEAERQLHHHDASDGADRSLGAVHDRLARRLDEFETRLERIERTLGDPPARGSNDPASTDHRDQPHKLPLPPQNHAA